MHQPEPHFAVESMRKYRTNVIGFQLVTGARQWYMMGCYLAPDNTLTIERVVDALRDRPKGADLMVAGDLNTNLADPEGYRREEDIAVTIAREGI